MARFYADENFSYRVAEVLRLLGHDVLTVQEAGERGGADARVLAYATAAARAVLTFDRHNFERLHRASAVHGGIVSCTWDVAGRPGRPYRPGGGRGRPTGRQTLAR